jgi:hypothetical protein
LGDIEISRPNKARFHCSNHRPHKLLEYTVDEELSVSYRVLPREHDTFNPESVAVVRED